MNFSRRHTQLGPANTTIMIFSNNAKFITSHSFLDDNINFLALTVHEKNSFEVLKNLLGYRSENSFFIELSK